MRPITQKLWNRLLGRAAVHPSSPQSRQHHKAHLELEPLEARNLLATASGTIAGVAFVDSNGNGTHEASELGLPGVPVALTGTTSNGTPISISTSTDSSGAYNFSNVLTGTYKLSGGPAKGVLSESAAVFDGLSVAGGQTINQDFAFRGFEPASISLRLFLTSTTSNDLPHAPAGSGSALGNYRPNNLPTVTNAISDFNVTMNSADTVIDLAAKFTDSDLRNTTVKLDTSMGAVNVNLFDAQAPQTVANYLDYVNSGAYNNSIFHRLSTGFVLQGGGFSFVPGSPPQITTIPALPAVQNEFGASNLQGTLAMAKLGGDPDSATDQFFINLANNSGNLDNQNGGFTVFGQLASPADQTVVNALVNPPVAVKNESAFNSAFDTIPLVNYTDKSPTQFPTDTTAANYDLIKSAAITNQDEVLQYSVVSSNTSVVTASIANERLTLHYVNGQTGNATITVRAADRYGTTVEMSFNVGVITTQSPTAAVTLSSSSPQTNDNLTATVTTTSPSGNPVALTYVWRVNGKIVKTTTDTTSTTDSLNLSQTGNGNFGDSITVQVTPKDLTLKLTGATASANATVANSPPTATVALNPPSPATNATLTATVTSADADGDSRTFTYVWSVNGTTVKTTSSTAATTDTLDLSQAGNGDTGDIVKVDVTPNDGKANGSVATANITVG